MNDQPQAQATSTADAQRRPKKARKSKPKSQRCFFGLSFPLSESLAPLQQDLTELATQSEQASGLRLVSPGNLHVTLKFLGTVDAQQLAAIKLQAASICQKFAPLELECQGIGLFKNSVWVGIRDHPVLAELAASLDLVGRGVGIAREAKTYRPHVTVARFKASDRLKLSVLLEKYQQKVWGGFESRKVRLYLSETLQEGARYSILRSFELGEPGDPESS